MKLSKFKKDCKAVGLDWKLVRTRVEDEEWYEFLDTVDGCDSSTEVLDAFTWALTTEGIKFWEECCEKLDGVHLIQEFTPKKRLRLFKLLADDLGYEVKD